MGIGAARQGINNREWFVDPRGPERRMQVTRHDEAQTVVLSIWHGNACTGTFQLPARQAPRLIAHLADCLSVSTAEAPPTPRFTKSPSARFVDRVRRALADAWPPARRPGR